MISKSHGHLQTMEKKPIKIQNDSQKTCRRSCAHKQKVFNVYGECNQESTETQKAKYYVSSLFFGKGKGGGGGGGGGAKKVEFANSVYLDEEPCCIQNGQNSKEFLAILSAIGLK